MWPEITRAKNENRHELVLSGNEISERIDKDGLDASIFDLTTLNFLDIHETSLRVLPEGVSKLVNLQSLVLHSNKLETITPEVARLEKLKLLDLSRNSLKEIIEGINDLPNIVTINLAHNKLETFPQLTQTTKLTVIDLSSNNLREFPDICRQELLNLSEVRLTGNQIEAIPDGISALSALKTLELGDNKIKTLPGELADCSKLKVLNLKDNPISDRRLLKLIDQCRTKQVMDYVKQHSPKTAKTIDNGKTKKEKDGDESDEKECKYSIKVRYAGDSIKVLVDGSVKSVREYFVACLVNDISFTEDTFKKFIQLQNKLHETVCGKRNSSTIATHDLNKLPPGDLTYTTLPPDVLTIKPLNRTTTLTGAQLFARLQTEANNLRKEKKRNTYSGIHKYLYLIEGHQRYPCLLHSEGTVISFPPITNSDVTKIDLQTKSMLVEVTGSVSIHLCRTALDALLKEMVLLFEKDLVVTQVKATDVDGNLKAVYPSKTDLKFDQSVDIKVVRE